MKACISMLIIAISIWFLAYLAYNSYQDQMNKVENITTPLLLRTNDLGCSQYRFKHTIYWTCPKELNINSIEQTVSKTTEIQPVVSE